MSYPPMPWWLAGPAIGAITLTLLYVCNRRLGVSGGLENLCELVSRHGFFARAAKERWRLWFLGGLVLGGAVSALGRGGWHPTWAIPLLDSTVGLGPAGKLAWMFVGGLFVGFGTRLGNGCTSGHGIFGMSNLEPASLISTAGYMLSGAVTTNVIYRILFHG